MSKKIVVCGAGGFVGSAIVKRLIEKGHGPSIRAVSRRGTNFQDGVENVTADLFHREDCYRAVEGGAWVLNLAAKVGGIGYIQNNRAECMLSSLINTNLLLACRMNRRDLVRYFFASSSCVYPKTVEVAREVDAYPADPIDGYGWEKLFSERMCQAFADDYQLPVSIARYHGLYGPGDERGDAKKDHVIAAMCRKVVEAKLSKSNEITIWGDGTQSRSFLYIDDCVAGTLKMIWGGIDGPLNMANDAEVSVGQIVDALEDIAGVKLTRFYTTAAGRQRKLSDNRALKAALQWEPLTSIREGLEKTYRYFWDKALLGK